MELPNTFKPTCRIGNHVEKAGLRMHEAIRRDMKISEQAGVKMTCCQIFVMGPRNVNQGGLSPEERIGIANLVKETGLKIFVHGNYFDCICGVKKQWAWSLVRKELEICDEIGAAGLVIHLPKVAAKEIAATIPEMLQGGTKTRLYLEIESYKPTETTTYELPRKIAVLMQELFALERSHLHLNVKRDIGICLDTAHAWAAGVDIAEYEDAKKWLREMTEAAGGCNVIMHLNDQINAKGSGKDQHAPLAYGTIWGAYLKNGTVEKCGLHAVVEWLHERTIDQTIDQTIGQNIGQTTDQKTNQRCCILERKNHEPKIKVENAETGTVYLPTIDNIISDYLVLSKLL